MNGDTESREFQLVRLLDVFFLGPLMILVATKKDLSPEARFALFVAGLLTIFFNGANYLSIERKKRL